MMKKLIATLLVLMMIVSTVPALAGTVRYEGDGFNSPEAAVEAYIDYFNKGDMQGMLSTFAIETAVDHLDQRSFVKRLGVFQVDNFQFYPVFNEYSRDLAINLRVGKLSESLGYQLLLYAWPSKYGECDGRPINLGREDSAIDAFYNSFEVSDFASWFGNIAFERYIEPENLTEYFSIEANQNNIERMRLSYGCDELVERAALMRIAKEEGILLIECARFGDKWYNYSLSGNLAVLCNIDFFTGGLVVPANELMN